MENRFPVEFRRNKQDKWGERNGVCGPRPLFTGRKPHPQKCRCMGPKVSVDVTGRENAHLAGWDLQGKHSTTRKKNSGWKCWSPLKITFDKKYKNISKDCLVYSVRYRDEKLQGKE